MATRVWKVPVCTGCGGILGLRGLDAGCSCDPAHAKTGMNVQVAEFPFDPNAHQVELEFEAGVMTAKLICPESGCADGGHEGHCNLRDWFDNVCFEEMAEGKVSFPIAVNWPNEDDGPELKIVQPGFEVCQEEEKT